MGTHNIYMSWKKSTKKRLTWNYVLFEEITVTFFFFFFFEIADAFLVFAY